MKTILKMFILVAFALSISSAYAQSLMGPPVDSNQVVGTDQNAAIVNSVTNSKVVSTSNNVAPVAGTVTTVHEAFSTDTKEDGNGKSFPKFAITVVQTVDADGIPTETKYYLGYGWKAGTVLSSDGLSVTLTLKDEDGKKTNYKGTITYNKDWTFSIAW